MSDLFEKAVEDLNRRKAEYLGSRRPSRPQNEQFRWWKPTEEETIVTIRSPLDWWYSHWDVKTSRSIRCPGEGCTLCNQGSSVQLRFVLAVELPCGRVALLELRERHRAMLEQLGAPVQGQVGAVVRVFKLWRQPNAPVQIELVSRRSVVPIEVSRIVSHLGSKIATTP